MEEKIKDIFNNIKERLSNPFLFSFLIAFLVYNWEITLAIFYNDSEQIKAEGYKSIFEFVRKKWEYNGKLFMPIIIALGYTFVFPIFRILVNGYQTFFSKVGEKLDLYFSRGGQVSIDKFLVLRKSYNTKIDELVKIIKDESSLQEKNGVLLTEKNELNTKYNHLRQLVDDSENSNFLNGKWRLEKNDLSVESVPFTSVKKMYFKNGDCFIDDEAKPRYFIPSFIKSPNSNKIIFVLESFTIESQSAHKLIFLFIVNTNKDNSKLVGNLNGNQIALIRIE